MLHTHSFPFQGRGYCSRRRKEVQWSTFQGCSAVSGRARVYDCISLKQKAFYIVLLILQKLCKVMACMQTVKTPYKQTTCPINPGPACLGKEKPQHNAKRDQDSYPRLLNIRGPSSDENMRSEGSVKDNFHYVLFWSVTRSISHPAQWHYS